MHITIMQSGKNHVEDVRGIAKTIGGQVSRMDRKEAIEYAKFRLECHTKGDGEYTDYGEFLVVAIAALQEPERIIKQLEELRDEPLMYCSEDYWEGHYMAAKEAIAIVRGEEE